MNILIYTNIYKNDFVDCTKQAINILNVDHNCYVEEKYFSCLNNCNIYNDEHIDLILIFGGDGTLLNYFQKAIELNTTVAGVKVGHLGYLCNLELCDLYDLKLNNYTIENRLLLTVNNNLVLNDVVVYKKNISKAILIEYTYDNKSFKFKADGLIVSTPTGSSAYNKSCFGPLIDTKLDVLSITPICPHDDIMPLVVDPNKEIIINTFKDYDMGGQTIIDGKNLEDKCENLLISRSDTYLKLLVK